MIMATIKSYTSLEQSKKLAEILPLESADGCWRGTTNPLALNNTFWLFTKYVEGEGLPAWSLAALLELLPKRLEIVDNVYELNVYLYGLYYFNPINGNLCFETQCKGNLVDACYEMIEKLHELNLL